MKSSTIIAATALVASAMAGLATAETGSGHHEQMRRQNRPGRTCSAKTVTVTKTVTAGQIQSSTAVSATTTTKAASSSAASSAVPTSASVPSVAPVPLPVAVPDAKDCKCGYVKDGNYLPEAFSIDFTKSNTAAAISAAGMYVTSTRQWQIGVPAPDGTTAYGDAGNIRAAGESGIELVVPGGQAGNKQVTGAEIAFQNGGKGMSRLFAEVEMQIDPTPGTCQSLFSFARDHVNAKDEHDIEILGASIFQDSPVAPKGIQLTNHPSDMNNWESDYKIVDFPADPTTAMHRYGINWQSGEGAKVTYSFDGQKLEGPTKFIGIRESNVIINHWSTTHHAFFGAPMPDKDVALKVKGLKVYYAGPGVGTSLPSGCSQSDVCAI